MAEEGRRKDTRSWFEVMEPEGSKGSWRELPGLLRSSIALVWQAGRRELLVTSSIQLATALSFAAQLFVAREVLHAILGAESFASVLPWLLTIVGLTILLDFARAVEGEQSPLLGELVGRRALDRVIDVATAADLLEFEDPEFHDRRDRRRDRDLRGRSDRDRRALVALHQRPHVARGRRRGAVGAFFRDAPFVILDEPTAALDARAESRLFERIRVLLAGRSVLLISHRFSSVRSADRIYVLERGRITEEGTHDALMAAGGTYADLFTLQAAAYLEREPSPVATARSS